MLVRTRFAPSPTGSPHVGNIRTALFSWLLARRHGGRFLLRIEDTDRSREVPGAREEIEESLRWLGLDWDEGPGVGGDYGPYVQSERLDIYEGLTQRLLEQGDAYRCFCTPERLTALRERQQAEGRPTMYDRKCRDQGTHSGDAPFVVRLAMPLEGKTILNDHLRGPVEFDNAGQDDPVLIKSDGYPTYHFAAMVDDHLMEITHVIRAEEWLSSAPKHIRLYEAFGWEHPVWVHPSIILGPDRKRLSKRHGATSVLELREQGFLADALVNFLALCGWAPGDDREIMSRPELIEAFSLEGIQTSPAIFDHEKLRWMNGSYIREMPAAEFVAAARPCLERAGLTGDEAYLAAALPLEQERVRTLAEVPEAMEFFLNEEYPFEEKGVRKWFVERDPGPILDAAEGRFGGAAEWTAANLEAEVNAIAEDLGLEKRSPVIHTLRVAITGRTTGPGLFETLEVMGRERVLRRLRSARAEAARRR